MDILLLSQSKVIVSRPDDPKDAGGDRAALQDLQEVLQALRRALQAVLSVSSCAARWPTCPTKCTAAACPLAALNMPTVSTWFRCQSCRAGVTQRRQGSPPVAVEQHCCAGADRPSYKAVAL